MCNFLTGNCYDKSGIILSQCQFYQIRGEIIETQCTALIDVLKQIPDCRSKHGQRHPLSAILALAIVAMMCGYRSYSAIAEWGRNYGQKLTRTLGFTRDKTPCAATFYNVFSKLDLFHLETHLAQWVETVLATTAVADDDDTTEAIAIDGKTLRGSLGQKASICHLLSAVSHRLGLTLFQKAVDRKTNEITVITDVLESIVLEGRVITVDALLTQPKIANTILRCGGEYIMPVKANQPNLLQEISLVFDNSQLLPDSIETYQTTDLCHGRIETRRIATSAVLNEYSHWPSLAQVFKIEREVIFKRTGKTRQQVVYGVTSLSAEKTPPNQLLEMVTQHWTIENKSHWVRDVTYDEDRSQVRAKNIPQVMAAIRNTAIGLMRFSAFANMASAIRYFAANPAKALTLIGIPLESESR